MSTFISIPLWSSPSIDAIGIDVYWPLADWRPGTAHLDRASGARSIYDLAYLKGNVFGGEGYDWYYASDADRLAQTRTPITDGSGKPWVFRFKDIRNWWSNAHHNRPGGVEAATADRMGPAIQADLVHGSRLPRHRSRRQPAQCLLRSQERGIGASLFLQRRPR